MKWRESFLVLFLVFVCCFSSDATNSVVVHPDYIKINSCSYVDSDPDTWDFALEFHVHTVDDYDVEIWLDDGIGPPELIHTEEFNNYSGTMYYSEFDLDTGWQDVDANDPVNVYYFDAILVDGNGGVVDSDFKFVEEE